MNIGKIKNNNILRIIVILSIVLVIIVFFRYRPRSWPAGTEAPGCLVSIFLIITALLIHWLFRNKIINNSQKWNVALGLGIGVLLSGCYRTEGTLKIEGKVIDEFTKVQIPGREIIVQGLFESNNELVPIEVGQFSTDSTGRFRYSLKKIKDVRHYNFCIVGDSDYAASTNELNLFQLEENAKYLFFSLNKLAGLTIKIQKISNTPYRDTLYLSWESNKVDFKTLYPYHVDNYGISDNSFGLIPYFGLRWIGENINSTVKTRVFAGKMTRIHWELVRNKKRKEITDTIICKRDISHIVYFKY
jgi:hypothetical protein